MSDFFVASFYNRWHRLLRRTLVLHNSFEHFAAHPFLSGRFHVMFCKTSGISFLLSKQIVLHHKKK